MTSWFRIGLPIALVLGASSIVSAQAQVAENAGVGSDVTWADKGVVELGGTLAFTHASETTIFRISPLLGYFVADNIELTLFPDLSIIHLNETDVTFGVLLEPSYHLEMSQSAFVFIGAGVGIRYAEDPGVDFAVRPKLGLDLLVGRSGILKPALFLDIGTNDGVSQGGFEASFTVML